MALNDRMKPEERPSCVCVLPPLLRSLWLRFPPYLSCVGSHREQLYTLKRHVSFFFGGGLLFLFLFLAVDQRTQLIECDLGGSSSSALSRPLARSPQSVGVIKGAHSSSKKKKKGQAPRPHFITGESLEQDAEPHAFPRDAGLSLTPWPLCEEWEAMNNFFF